MSEPSSQTNNLGHAHWIDASAVAQACNVDVTQGLTHAEAAQRLRAQGPNTLRSAPKVSVWRRWLAQFQDALVLLLLAAIVIALAAWWIEGHHGWPLDAVVIMVVVLLNASLGRLQEAKAERAVAALGHLTQATATVLREGQPTLVPSSTLVNGDVLLLREGDAVGADARLLQATALRLLEAPLTGESESILKDTAPLPPNTPLAERNNMVFNGTAVTQGHGRAVITATGMATALGNIAQLLDSTATKPPPLQVEVARTGRRLGLLAVAIALVVVATILMMSEIHSLNELTPVLLLGVSVAVAAVPEGLPALLSVVLALGVQRMAPHHAIMKGLSTVETLGCASVIAADKTGTLTSNQMTIQRAVTASGLTHFTGEGYAPNGHVEQAGVKLSSGPLLDEQRWLLRAGSLANNAQLQQLANGNWQILGDPTEGAFLVAARKLQLDDLREQRFQREAEVPFTSERQMMSVVVIDHGHANTRLLITKGAPDALLARSNRLRVGMLTVPLNDVLRAHLQDQIDAMADEALRTLAVAYKPLDTPAPPLHEHLKHPRNSNPRA